MMMTLVGPLLVLSGFGLYMLSNTHFGRFRRIPWEFLAVSALGVVVAVATALRAGGTASAIAAIVSAVLFAFLLWFLFGYTMYAGREDRPRVGDRFSRVPAADLGRRHVRSRRRAREAPPAHLLPRQLVTLLHDGARRAPQALPGDPRSRSRGGGRQRRPARDLGGVAPQARAADP